MMGIFSVALLLVMTLLAVIPNLSFRTHGGDWGIKAHRAVCIGVFVLGCAMRLIALGRLPEGMSAEEALVGVQAARLAAGGEWIALLAQWNGEATGPLLSALTAPFVAVGGMNAWSVRLPLALCSCAALPAAYGVGKALSGRQAGRWCLTLYALCPYFVLSARLTAGANLAACVFLLALWALLCGLKKRPLRYLGTALMGLLPYAQEMYTYIVPLGLLLSLGMAVHGGLSRRHAAAAWTLGLLIALPALLTAWVNLTGREGFTLLGVVRIPRVEGYAPAWIYDGLGAETTVYDFTLRSLFEIAVSAFFGVLTHENISPALFAPEGLYALYLASLPVAVLGATSLVWQYAKGERIQGRAGTARAMVAVLAAVTVAALFLMGRRGVFVDATALPFTVLLCAAGLCRIERRSGRASAGALAVYACSMLLLGVHLFGGAYQEGANVYFSGLREAAQAAKACAQERNLPIVMTTYVYPHREPAAAAEMLMRYALGSEAEEVPYTCAYVAAEATLNEGTIYILNANQIDRLDMDAFDVYEYSDFMLLVPAES